MAGPAARPPSPRGTSHPTRPPRPRGRARTRTPCARATSRRELAKRGDVLAMRLVRPRSLDHHRTPLHRSLGQDRPEPVAPDVSFADVLVAIALRSAGELGVVRVHEDELPREAALLELREARAHAVFGVELVAAGEQVARVEAQSHPGVTGGAEQARGLGDR